MRKFRDRLVFLFCISSFAWSALGAPTVINQDYLSTPDTNIHVLFDEDIDPVTLDGTTVQLGGSVSGTVTSTLSYDVASAELTIDPDSSFANGELVDVTLTTGITNLAGSPMLADHTFNFYIQLAASGAAMTATCASLRGR